MSICLLFVIGLLFHGRVDSAASKTENHLICNFPPLFNNGKQYGAGDKHQNNFNANNCREANYLEFVREGLKDSKNPLEKSILDAILHLYDDLKTSNIPDLVAMDKTMPKHHHHHQIKDHHNLNDHRSHAQKIANPISEINPSVKTDVILVHPISFGIPEDNIVDISTHKDAHFSRVIPGIQRTYYSYKEEKEFIYDMQHSLYSFTYKKAGWDCLRHLEIIAAGSIPLFINIDKCPRDVLANHPKKLYQLLLQLPALTDNKLSTLGEVYDSHYKINPVAEKYLSSIDSLWEEQKFNRQFYAIVTAALLQYARNVFTTTATAQYILTTMHTYTTHNNPPTHSAESTSTALNSNNTVSNSRKSSGFQFPKAVLYLTHDNEDLASGDYMIELTLHGLKSLLGEAVVTDYPRRNGSYKTLSDFNTTDYHNRRHSLYGNGFSWGMKLDGILDSTSHNRTAEVVQKNIETNFYDLIILGSGHRDGLPGYILPFWVVVSNHYSPDKVAVINGDDFPCKKAFLEKFAHTAKHIFCREGYVHHK